ncbi:conserved hypothetical protein [Segniliparus rotundus DSM 44985]|uniref:Uncharacterized protein n=1 Tax=Segniliparus rotundus (strain ATCC BAA-972 / CDC 1076 / CIP 108378 / DSM 44985 / JCM 13578) TaxID=640132 RepID=D6ZA61_SEGRD|nr:hypothetical protein [Segniliparus rotundus]ADG98731.1 conserved hypothetical protein [Segniliparus rotundus DSM 44985]
MIRVLRGLGVIAAVTAGLGVASQIAAQADPEEGDVAIQCDVWAQPMGGFGRGGIPQHAGTVTGHGPNEGAAREDAERQKWGPYGNMPHLQNCHPV